MKEKFPWWLWLGGVLSFWPVLFSPIFLFGNPFGFDLEAGALWRLLQIVVSNLPWIVPMGTVLMSFDLYRRGWYARAAWLIGLTVLGESLLAYHLVYS